RGARVGGLPAPRAQVMAKKRVVVVCPGVWDEEALQRPGVADRYEIVREGTELVAAPSLVTALTFDVFRWVRGAARRHRRARLDGVVGPGDYPGCMLAAAVGEALGRPTPRFADVVRLSHKYYSREIQRRLVPEATPRFTAYDPLAPRAEPPLAF